MKSNYRRLGDLICEVNNRNTELKVTNLLGINIDKFFMPSVANVIGTDMTSYKIVKKNQFACNRMHVGRDQRLPVSLSKDSNDFLVSPAYDVFEATDTQELLPEYLMMWFSRGEFDRNAWFYTDADVRGGLNWKDFCNMELPVPTIAKQREIVKEYNVLVDRINLNNRLVQKLEETAQAVYKQWFVDFEFPDEDGKPYKLNGGEMVDSELGEIPKGWEIRILENIMGIKHGYAFEGENIVADESENILLTPVNFRLEGGFNGERFKYYTDKVPKEYIFNTGDLMVTMTDLSKASDTLGYPAFIPEIKGKTLLHNQRLGKLEILNEFNVKYFIYWLMRSSKYRQTIVGSATGTTVKHTSPSKILMYKLPFCNDRFILNKFENIASKIQTRVNQVMQENHTLLVFKSLLLSKLVSEGI